MAQSQTENADWLQKLNNAGAQQGEAIEELRKLLLRAALFTFSRNLGDLERRSSDDVLALAEDCAQDALIAVLQQLHTFRGESRFTTWVYKFGVHKALEAARRERWKNRSIDPYLEDADAFDWLKSSEILPGDHSNPAVQMVIWKVIQQVICEELTARQRQVVKLMVFDEVPMDVVTERLNTNRNAVYKTLHDARKRIRQRLEEHGYAMEEIMALFNTPVPRGEDDLPRGDC